MQKLQAKQLELTQAEEEVSGANDDDEEARIRQEMDDLRKEATDQAELKRKLESERKLAIVPYKAKERDLKSLKKDKERANKELSRARERLQDARAEILAKAGSAESDEARRTSALADNERLLAEAQEATNRFKQAQATSYQDWEEFSAQVDQAIQVTATKRSQVKAVDHKLGELNSSSGNSLAIFGQKCVKMHQLVSF